MILVCAYRWWLISGKHPPRVPADVSSESCMLSFPKAIEVLRGEACGDGKEHVPEGEARELRVPTATREHTLVQSWAQASANTGSMAIDSETSWVAEYLDPCSNNCETTPVVTMAVTHCQVSVLASLFVICLLQGWVSLYWVLGSWTTRTTSPSSLHFYVSLPNISAWINAWMNG